MDVMAAVRTAITRCGGETVLKKDNISYRFAACIMPASYNTQSGRRTVRTCFGKADPRQFVYYGPLNNGGELVEDGVLLKQGKLTYLVTLCHDFCWSGDAVFRWATLQRQEDYDGTVYEAQA